MVMMMMLLTASQQSQANVSLRRLENSFWHEQTTAATPTEDGEINGYLGLTKTRDGHDKPHRRSRVA